MTNFVTCKFYKLSNVPEIQASNPLFQQEKKRKIAYFQKKNRLENRCVPEINLQIDRNAIDLRNTQRVFYGMYMIIHNLKLYERSAFY